MYTKEDGYIQQGHLFHRAVLPKVGYSGKIGQLLAAVRDDLLQPGGEFALRKGCHKPFRLGLTLLS